MDIHMLWTPWEIVLELSSGDGSFGSIWQWAVNNATDSNLVLPDLDASIIGGRKHPMKCSSQIAWCTWITSLVQHRAGTTKDTLKMEIFYSVIDTLILELNARFCSRTLTGHPMTWQKPGGYSPYSSTPMLGWTFQNRTRYWRHRCRVRRSKNDPTLGKMLLVGRFHPSKLPNMLSKVASRLNSAGWILLAGPNFPQVKYFWANSRNFEQFWDPKLGIFG